MKRLVAVSWEMPPMYGPRGSQVAATLGELAARGWRPSVVCLDPRRGGPHWPDGGPADLPAGVDVVRVRSSEESLTWRAAARLAPIVRRFPDDKRLWVRPAAAAVQRELGRGADGLITFAQPWSDHLVGLRIRRRVSVPWVAHFSDPWVDSPYARAAPWIERVWRRLEADVIDQADAVVFVTGETADLVMRKYPASWARKVAVVPHGFDPRSIIARPDRKPAGAGPLRIVYTGRFYRGIRTPTMMLRALAMVNARRSLAGRLELTCIGPHVCEYQAEVVELGLQAIVHLEERRTKRDAARAAADADVLLVVDAPSSGPNVFLPSKLVDYLAFAKPLFAITPVEGATARLVDRLGGTHAPADDVDAIAAAVETLLARWQEGTLHVSNAFHDVAAEFDIRRTTAQLDDVLTRAFRPS